DRDSAGHGRLRGPGRVLRFQARGALLAAQRHGTRHCVAAACRAPAGRRPTGRRTGARARSGARPAERSRGRADRDDSDGIRGGQRGPLAGARDSLAARVPSLSRRNGHADRGARRTDRRYEGVSLPRGARLGGIIPPARGALPLLRSRGGGLPGGDDRSARAGRGAGDRAARGARVAAARALRAAGVDSAVADHVKRLRDRLRASRYGPRGLGDVAELAAELAQVLRVLGAEPGGKGRRVVAAIALMALAALAPPAAAQTP